MELRSGNDANLANIENPNRMSKETLCSGCIEDYPFSGTDRNIRQVVEKAKNKKLGEFWRSDLFIGLSATSNLPIKTVTMRDRNENLVAINET